MRLTRASLLAALAIVLYVALVIMLAMPLLGNQDLPEELRIDTIDHNRGTVGSPLRLRINGQGFDPDTRFSLVLDSGNRQAIVKRFNAFEAIYTLLLDDQTLYLGCRDRTLWRIDLTAREPFSPRKMGSMSGQPTALLKTGKILWAASGQGELKILSPYQGSLKERQTVAIMDLAAGADETLLVAAGRQGLLTFRAQEEQSPIKLGALTFPGSVLAVARIDHLAFVGDSKTGLHICDLTDPEHPRPLARLALPGTIQDITPHGRRVLIGSTAGLLIVDVQNPRQPRLLSHLSLGTIYQVLPSDDQAYLAAGAAGLLRVDIRDPKQPRLSGHLTPGESIRRLALDGERAYLGTDGSGLLIVDLKYLGGHPEWLPQKREVPIPMQMAQGTTPLEGEHLTSILTQARQQLPADCSVESMAYNETAAYLATACGLATVPLGEPGALTLLRQPLAYTNGIWLTGETAYVTGAKQSIPQETLLESLAASTQGVQLFDLHEPLNPRPRGFIPTDGTTLQIWPDQDRVYLAVKKKAIMIVDSHDPDQPLLLGSVQLPWPEQAFAGFNRIHFKDNTLYVANDRAGLQVFDVGDPRHPRRTAALNVPGGGLIHICGSGDQMFVYNSNGDLQIYDIGTPGFPHLVGVLDRFSPLGHNGIEATDGKLLLNSTLIIERALPLAAEKVDLKSSAQAEIVFPPPVFTGDYFLYAFNDQGRQQLPGVIHVEAAQK